MGKKKICVVSATNEYLVPYFNDYLNVLEGVDYDVIYWNHDNLHDFSGAATRYEYKNNKRNSIEKLIGYIEFSRHIVKCLKRTKYDVVIFLHNQFAVFNSGFLLRNYRGKFIYDVRDYTFEKFKPYFKREERLVNNSLINVISSPGYREFLPQAEYVLTNNYRAIDKDIVAEYRKERKSTEPIVIINIGLIRFHDQNKKLILQLKNDKRFEMHFIGKGALELESFVTENGCKNVVLHDWFDSSATMDFLKNADMIFNLYGNNTPMLDYALSNKLYYAAGLGMPILVCNGTYMEKISIANGFGFTFAFQDDDADRLYDYYVNLDRKQFYEDCDRYINLVTEEKEMFLKCLRKLIS